MLQHLLYIVAPSELEKTKTAMARLSARPVPASPPLNANYELRHQFLGDLVLNISLLTDLDGVTPHMRQNPVDLLVYDERGENWGEAVQAIRHIRDDVRRLGDLWGPDFYFPMSRVVAVLKEESQGSHRTFDLGRMNVRDVFVAPKSAAALMRWLKEVLYHGVIRKNRVGMALSGGGLEGFLYQVGVLYALEQAVKDRGIADCDIVSGVSSGAIAGSIAACKIPVREVIKSFHGMSQAFPAFTSNTLFDLAGTHIIRRIAREVLAWGFKPSQWPSKTLRSIPTGFFKGDKLEQYFRELIVGTIGDDSFEKLKTELYVGATDQDSFEHVTFGAKPWDKLSVSAALRASCAFPPIYAPKSINGRRYIDGQVTRSANLHVVVERGARLVFVIDPLKPHTTSTAGFTDEQGGFFGAIQTIKALCSTRFEADLLHVSSMYPDVDFMVFQPDDECAKLMAGSPMRFRIRVQIIEAAYKATLRRLRERHHVYSVKMGRYGFNLKSPQKIKELEESYFDLFASAS